MPSSVTKQTVEQSGRDGLLKSFTFSFFMTNAILISFLPTYLVQLGFSKTQIGLIYSIGPTIGIISNLFWGYTSDKYQTIKKTILIVLSGQLMLSMILFQVNSFWLLFILMACFYFFQTPLNSLNDSQILIISESRKKSYASFRVWGSIGFAFSALVFGLLLHSANKNPHMIAFLMIGTITMSLLLSIRLRDSRGGYAKIQFSGLYQVIMSRKLLVFLLLVLIISMAHRTNDAFLSLYLNELGADQTWIGYAWTVSALSEIPVFFFLSRYGHHFKELALLALAGLFYAIRFYFMSIATHPLQIVMIQAMHSITFGIFLFTALRYILQLVPDQYRATGQAIYAVVWSGIAGLISSTIGGTLFDHWGGRVVYQNASLIALIASVGFLIAHLKNEN